MAEVVKSFDRKEQLLIGKSWWEMSQGTEEGVAAALDALEHLSPHNKARYSAALAEGNRLQKQDGASS